MNAPDRELLAVGAMEDGTVVFCDFSAPRVRIITAGNAYDAELFRINASPEGADTVTTPRHEYANRLREAANIVGHFGITAESENHVFDYDPADLADGVVTDTTPIKVSALGASMLADCANDDGTWEFPRDWDTEPVDGYTGFLTVALFALYLVIAGRAQPSDISACTITAWSAGRRPEVVELSFNLAADAMEKGRIPAYCTVCNERFGWDVELEHVPDASWEMGGEDARWLILHDGTACCPARDDAHDRRRRAMLADEAPAFVTDGDLDAQLAALVGDTANHTSRPGGAS